MRKVALILSLILTLTFSQLEGGAKCYRMLDLDLSTASSDTVEVTAWNGSGEVAFFLNITGHAHGGSAGKITFYAEVQDSLWALRQVASGTVGNGYTVADGYKCGSVVVYGGLANPLVDNKVYCDKLHVAYVDNDDSAGHVTLDVCIKKD